VRFSLLAIVVLSACKSGGGDNAGSAEGSAPAPKRSGGGFSASLSAELEGSGSGMAGSATGSATAAMRSASSATGGTAAGSAIAGSAMAASAGSATAKDTGANDAKAGVAANSAALAGSASTPPAKDSAVPQGNATAMKPPDHHAPVKVPPELAMIKLDLEPNWDRDYDQAGTISFVLKVPNTGDTRLFAFHYGYDDPKAPTDREQYKKFLGDSKLLTVTLDRQRGAAWYLEGTDSGNNPAFRYLVTYGGKRLVCYGLLYKDKASTALGPDLRDKVVAAAKKICETLAL
jgi:hypothetical protein